MELQAVALSVGNSAFLAFLLFGAGAFLAGMLFARLDSEPAAQVAISVCAYLKWFAVIILFSVFFIFLGHPAGLTVALWFGTVLGYFAAFFFSVSEILSKGGDFKPIAWYLLFGTFLLAGYVATSGAVIPWGTAMGKDVLLVLCLADLATLVGFLALRFAPRLIRPAGIIFMLVGIDCLYIVIRYVAASVGMGSF
jgi:hypothetical protein